MKPNIRCHDTDELMMLNFHKGRAMRMEHPEDNSMEVRVYLVVAGITWTYCLLIWWMG